MTTKQRSKPHPGHKLTHYSYGVQTNCECGFHSATWFGPGARRNALAEWRTHIDRCKAKEASPPFSPNPTQGLEEAGFEGEE